MTDTSSALLINPHPRGHILYPYTDEKFVTNAVSLFAGSGLKNGEAVILVMTSEHMGPVLARLAEDGHPVDLLIDRGQLVCRDAAQLLDQLLVSGRPNAYVFRGKIGALIEAARSSVSADDPPAKVRVFGEMVSLLWNSGRQLSAENLEALWNEIIAEYSIALLCTYNLCAPSAGELSEEVFRMHTHTCASSSASGCD